jgi:hypothetical protein
MALSLLSRVKIAAGFVIAFLLAVGAALFRARRRGEAIGTAKAAEAEAKRTEAAAVKRIDEAAKSDDPNRSLRKEILGAIVLGFVLAGRAMAAPALSPETDCPKDLVCFTVEEATNIAKERVALNSQVAHLTAQLALTKSATYSPKLAPYWAIGGSKWFSADGEGLGGYGEIGVRLGPVAVSAGLQEYDSTAAFVGISYSRRF